jgi:hypothetical protein
MRGGQSYFPLRSMLGSVVICTLAGMLVLVPAPMASAAVIEWDGGPDPDYGGVWENPINWVGNLGPDPLDIARFGVNETYTVTVNAHQEISGLQVLAGNVTFEMPLDVAIGMPDPDAFLTVRNSALTYATERFGVETSLPPFTL